MSKHPNEYLPPQNDSRVNISSNNFNGYYYANSSNLDKFHQGNVTKVIRVEKGFNICRFKQPVPNKIPKVKTLAEGIAKATEKRKKLIANLSRDIGDKILHDKKDRELAIEHKRRLEFAKKAEERRRESTAKWFRERSYNYGYQYANN